MQCIRFGSWKGRRLNRAYMQFSHAILITRITWVHEMVTFLLSPGYTEKAIRNSSLLKLNLFLYLWKEKKQEKKNKRKKEISYSTLKLINTIVDIVLYIIQVFHSPSNSRAMCPIGSISILCFGVPLSRLAKPEIFATVWLVSMASLFVSSNFSFSFQNFSSSCFTLTWWNLSVVSFVCGKTAAGTSFSFAIVYTAEGTFSSTFKAVYMKKIKMKKKDSGSLGLKILLR